MTALGFAVMAADDPPAPKKPATDPPGEAAIRALAKKAGLDDLGSSRSAHYFGIGDAPTLFRENALKLCESLATTYQKHFKEKGFDLVFPPERMTVVILAGPRSYAKFTGEPVGETDGGHYDIEPNRLVMFDFKNDAGRKSATVARLNTFTLVHEAMHQLTFNSGLLNREGDVALAISEGLAAYGELWQLRDQKMGQTNSLRLKALDEWIPLEKLLTDDKVFSDPNTEQAAYAEAWLLIHTLMSSRQAMKGKLRAYLDMIRDRKDDSKRVADAVKTLGDLEKLDQELKKAAISRR